MDVLVGIVGSLAGKAVEYAVDPTARQLSYVFKPRSKFQNLRRKVQDLKDARERVQQSVEAANRNGEKNEEKAMKRCFAGFCPDLMSSYQLSKKADREADAIAQLLTQKDAFKEISYLPALQVTDIIRPVKEYDAFESRSRVLDEVMTALKDDTVSIIGVHGMGGVGKTTLVKEVAGKAKEKLSFDEVVFVAVTQTPNTVNLQNEIANKLGMKLDDDPSVDVRAARLLDQHKGCKILITSRKLVVLKSMDSQKSLSIDILNEVEAWNLFKKVAGHIAERSDLQSTAMEVAQKCAGLPLAITTVAKALKHKENLYEWKDALEQLKPSEINSEGITAEAYSAIDMSYRYLKREELKYTFLLCSIMDHDAAIEDLLKYCWGLGLFPVLDTMEKVRNRVLTLVSDLKDSSLLLASSTPERFDMHDVVRDVAISIASRDRHWLAIGKEDVFEKREDTMRNSHLVSLKYAKVSQLPDELECPNLTFFFMYGSVEVPDNIFKGMQRLEVLEFGETNFTTLPSSFGFLKTLCTLRLIGCDVEDIVILGELENLEILDLRRSRMKMLPKEIGQLTKLKLLDLSSCFWLELIPLNVLFKLSKLEELYLYNSFDGWEIEGIENPRSKASLMELQHLSRLTTLEAHIPDVEAIPNDILFLGKMERFKISIGGKKWGYEDDRGMETSRMLKLKINKSIDLTEGVYKLLSRKTESLSLQGGEDVVERLYDLNVESFEQLRFIKVENCNMLKNLFSFSIAKSLFQLEELEMSEIGRERSAENSKKSIASTEEWTVFIDNLSKRVSRRVLREFFSPYGQIVRIFIPRFLEKSKYKSSTFAFVQFIDEESREKAIQSVNGRWFDGRRLSVGVAKYQKGTKKEVDDGKSMLRIKSREQELVSNGLKAKSLQSFRDGRTYKEVARSDVNKRREQESEMLVEGSKRNATGVRNVWEMHIATDNFKWVKRSLTGIMKSTYDYESVKEALEIEGLGIQVSRWGYAWKACIITFNSVDEFSYAWENKKEVLSLCFDWLAPAVNENGVPLALCQIELCGLPLLCWNEAFLEKLTKDWGRFICFKEESKMRYDLSSAKVLLRVESPFDVPEMVTVGSYGRSFKVKILMGSVLIQPKELGRKMEEKFSNKVNRDSVLSESEEDCVPERAVEGEDFAEISSHKVTSWLNNGHNSGMNKVTEGQATSRKSNAGKSNCGLSGFVENRGEKELVQAEQGVELIVEQAIEQRSIIEDNVINSHRQMDIDRNSVSGDHEVEGRFLDKESSLESTKNSSQGFSRSTNLMNRRRFRIAPCHSGSVCSEGEVEVRFHDRIYRRVNGSTDRESVDYVREVSQPSQDFVQARQEAEYTREVCDMLGISFKGGNQIVEDEIFKMELGLGKSEKIRAVSRLVLREKPAILLLQESKLNVCRSGLTRKLGGNLLRGSCFVPADGSAGGLICLWNENYFEVSAQINSSRFMALSGKFNMSNFECVIINVYGPSVEADKEEFFRDFLCAVQSINLPVFYSVIKFDGFTASRGRFTWSNNRESTTWVRLDRFLISGSFLNQFPNVIQKMLPKSLSDHNPVLLVEECNNWGPKPFRFYNYMLQEDGFVEAVESSLSNLRRGIGGRGLFSLLRGTKQAIRNWPRNNHRGFSDAISELESRINGLELKLQEEGTSFQEWDLMIVARKELWNLHRKEESIWLQRSRVRWSIEGDRNTKFFHMCALNRNRFNTISSLKVAEEVISEPDQLRGFVFNYFKDNFNSVTTLEVDKINLTFAKLTDDQKKLLEVRFSEQEVWEAVFHSDSAKAPGPDGFTMGFFKKFWPSLKSYIMKFVEDFYNGRIWEHGVNHSFLTLIPKIRNPEGIEDYRPISLVGSLYKIISKVLARRLAAVISVLVSPSQFAFIPGRQLLDCVFLANEVIDDWRKKERKGVVFKVDFRRAYDSVEWPILLRLLRIMGFGDRWLSWIDLCISSASISVLVNGSPTNEFKMGKGLRQGCSLSPMLFNIVGELLNLMLIKAADSALFEGFSVGRAENKFHLTHLQFADDLILFCRDSSAQIMNIRRVLRIFGLMTGLQLNLSKSKLFGVNMDEEVLKEWATFAGCGVGALPMTYLGIPIGTYRNSDLLWEPINQKLNSLMAKFLWGDDPLKKRIHWVNWKIVCQPYEEGGLGVLDLSMANRVLLGKWVWKFANDKHSQWKEMICCKHNITNLSISINKAVNPQDSWIWRGIVNNYEKNDDIGNCLRSNSKIQVGNGRSIEFWNDIWANNSTLKEQFPRIYALSINKTGKVVDFGCYDNNCWSWNICLRRNLCDWELDQWISLMTLIDNIVLIDAVDDFLIWSGSGDGLFSVKACRSALIRSSGGNFQWKKWVWSGLAPPKVETFLWQLSHQKLAVRVELKKRGIPLEELLCPLCQKEEETIHHLFMFCPVAWELWNLFINLWEVNTVLPKDPPSLLSSWSDLKASSSIWNFIPGVVMWTIWKARNLVVFEKWNFERSTLFFICRFRLAKWFLAKFPEANIQVDLLIGDPRLADGLAVNFQKKKKDLCWYSPPPDFYKFNVDGAVRSDGLQGGIGGLLRDSNGSTVIYFSKPVGPGPPLFAELKAIKEGIDLFLHSDWASKGRLILESDCKTAVDWIFRPTEAPSFFSSLVREIGDVISGRDIMVRLIPRACNWEADKLAKEGIGTLFLLPLVASSQEATMREVSCPALEELELNSIYGIEKIWHIDDQLPLMSFGVQSLTILKVANCHKLKYVFTSSMVKSFVHLKTLEVYDCDKMEWVIEGILEATEEERINGSISVFPKLDILVLNSLPKLKGFCFGINPIEFPSLRDLKIWGRATVPYIFHEKCTFPNLHQLTLGGNAGLKDIICHCDGQQQQQHMSHHFGNLKVITLEGYHKQLLPSYLFWLLALPNHQTLEISFSYFKEMVIQSEEGGEEKPASLLLSQITDLRLSFLPALMHLWKEKEGFPNLRILHVKLCHTLKGNLVPSSVSFLNLVTLKIDGCDGIIKLITHPTAESLVQLKEMSIINCKNIEEIIQGGDDDDDEISFPQLNRLELEDLPKLENFCSSGNYTFSFPSLKNIVVQYCPKMKMFSQGDSNTPMLNKVQLQKWGGEEVHLEGSLNSTIQQLFREKRVMIEECENSKEDQSKPSTSNTQVSVLFSGALGVLNTTTAELRAIQMAMEVKNAFKGSKVVLQRMKKLLLMLQLLPVQKEHAP
ncbi:hypothetical protein F3Y22_tig00009009pilonHSYRG00196 [Hibiscus syriacus]|uniref:Uncharacterized protein n=1 Tax=Hibiscus syriacus TaxID=106335 RepID=A0A6A3C9D3_HIBSY|nr:hypothetical protein F3Y22_tig00009009pilonHSYRG00196 [Hibiscus syriacus]